MRIIARLDIKGPNLIKGINLEGLKVVGDPNKFALNYYKDGADELIFMDIVASLYNRNSLHDIIKSTCKNIFIPITVGGGIRTIDDALKIFDSGADKISINTEANTHSYPPSAVYGLCGISKVWRPQKQQSIRLSSRRREKKR